MNQIVCIGLTVLMIWVQAGFLEEQGLATPSSILTVFEQYPWVGWALGAAVLFGIGIDYAHRRQRRRREALAGNAVLREGEAPWESVTRAEEEKGRSTPGYDSPYRRIAWAAHIIDVPFGEDGHGLEWVVTQPSPLDFEDMARQTEALGRADMADILMRSAALVDVAEESSDLEYDSPAYQEIVCKAEALEAEFRSAGGVEAFREMVDVYLLKHYPWAK